jgi:hypothetical protein
VGEDGLNGQRVLHGSLDVPEWSRHSTFPESNVEILRERHTIEPKEVQI